MSWSIDASRKHDRKKWTKQLGKNFDRIKYNLALIASHDFITSYTGDANGDDGVFQTLHAYLSVENLLKESLTILILSYLNRVTLILTNFNFINLNWMFKNWATTSKKAFFPERYDSK